MLTADGKRGEPNDTLLDMHAPTLFVIGQMATTARCEDIEDLRERMRVETGLVVVGSADDRLRVTKSRKMKDGLTQSMIDRCILDEIGDFLGSILMRPHPAPVRPVYTPPSPAPLQRTVVRGERVNKIPSTPSDTPESSEPSSPAAKRSRPGTPVNVPSSVVSTTASPSKPTLSTHSTLVSVSALNAGLYTLGDTGSIPGALQSAAGIRRKRLANLSSPQDKWGAHKSVSSRNTPAGMAQVGLSSQYAGVLTTLMC
uniref:Uncharacterized protein n=1 Tax=Timema douglasi TaxID=61478 RepID=A0A7R8ZIE5_TIMDO|nr:unnamed protein product [Timema douglasi]